MGWRQLPSTLNVAMVNEPGRVCSVRVVYVIGAHTGPLATLGATLVGV